MNDDQKVLTNTAAATRLRTLLYQLTHEPPPLGPRLVANLTPTPEEHVVLSPDNREQHACGTRRVISWTCGRTETPSQAGVTTSP